MSKGRRQPLLNVHLPEVNDDNRSRSEPTLVTDHTCLTSIGERGTVDLHEARMKGCHSPQHTKVLLWLSHRQDSKSGYSPKTYI